MIRRIVGKKLRESSVNIYINVTVKNYDPMCTTNQGGPPLPPSIRELNLKLWIKVDQVQLELNFLSCHQYVFLYMIIQHELFPCGSYLVFGLTSVSK